MYLPCEPPQSKTQPVSEDSDAYKLALAKEYGKSLSNIAKQHHVYWFKHTSDGLASDDLERVSKANTYLEKKIANKGITIDFDSEKKHAKDSVDYRNQKGELGGQKEKAADKGDLTLANGYRTESGRPLSKADSNEFIIKPDGSKTFGIITKGIENATNGELKAGEIRLKVGNEKQGLIHAKQHENGAKEIGYKSIEDLITDVSNNFDAIYKRNNGAGKRDSYILVKYKTNSTGNRNISWGCNIIALLLKTDSDH